MGWVCTADHCGTQAIRELDRAITDAASSNAADIADDTFLTQVLSAACDVIRSDVACVCCAPVLILPLLHATML